MAAARFLVQGVVQGVGFRYHTQKKATYLGLTGWVRNTPEGGVETCVQGPEATLEDFQTWLWEGPTTSRVVSVERTDLDENLNCDEFSIRP